VDYTGTAGTFAVLQAGSNLWLDAAHGLVYAISALAVRKHRECGRNRGRETLVSCCAQVGDNMHRRGARYNLLN